MRTRLVLLAGVMSVAFLGLLFFHARHLSATGRDARFVQFLCRHDRRPVTDTRLAARFAARLTIRDALQRRAWQLLKDRKGCVIALEPATGRIRAFVSSPGPDPSTVRGLVNGIIGGAPYFNRILDGLYPPGSTFKVFLAATALSEGLEPIYNCPADGYRAARATPPIRDSEAYAARRAGRTWRGFGRLGMGEALAHSSNVYFAQLGVELGTERFGRAVQSMRLRDPIVLLDEDGIELIAAGGGVPDDIKTPELAPLAIGQGELLLTPLSVALFTAAVANDGVAVKPTLSAAARPELFARPFALNAAQRVKKMMRAVVKSGTGRKCDLPSLDVCGKTGTAQTDAGADHAWFTCFAPMGRPRLVVTVLVEHGGFGAEAALPIARELLREAEREGMLK